MLTYYILERCADCHLLPGRHNRCHSSLIFPLALDDRSRFLLLSHSKRPRDHKHVGNWKMKTPNAWRCLRKRMSQVTAVHLRHRLPRNQTGFRQLPINLAYVKIWFLHVVYPYLWYMRWVARHRSPPTAVLDDDDDGWPCSDSCTICP